MWFAIVAACVTSAPPVDNEPADTDDGVEVGFDTGQPAVPGGFDCGQLSTSSHRLLYGFEGADGRLELIQDDAYGGHAEIVMDPFDRTRIRLTVAHAGTPTSPDRHRVELELSCVDDVLSLTAAERQTERDDGCAFPYGCFRGAEEWVHELDDPAVIIGAPIDPVIGSSWRRTWSCHTPSSSQPGDPECAGMGTWDSGWELMATVFVPEATFRRQPTIDGSPITHVWTGPPETAQLYFADGRLTRVDDDPDGERMFGHVEAGWYVAP